MPVHACTPGVRCTVQEKMVGPEGLNPSNVISTLDWLTRRNAEKQNQELVCDMANPVDPPGPPDKQNPAALVASANRAKAETREQATFDPIMYLTARAEAIAALAEPPFDAETLALIDSLDELIADADVEPCLGWTLAGRIGSTDDRERADDVEEGGAQ